MLVLRTRESEIELGSIYIALEQKLRREKCSIDPRNSSKVVTVSRFTHRVEKRIHLKFEKTLKSGILFIAEIQIIMDKSNAFLKGTAALFSNFSAKTYGIR